MLLRVKEARREIELLEAKLKQAEQKQRGYETILTCFHSCWSQVSGLS
jgi:CHASE3 domain sensor protein